MTRSRKTVARTAVAAAIGALLFGSPPPVRAAVECKADVRAQTGSDEVQDKYVDKVFVVTIASSESCAKVYFDLITTEGLFNGEEITSTRRDSRKVSAQQIETSVRYRIARDSSLMNWEVKLVRCVVCGTE